MESIELALGCAYGILDVNVIIGMFTSIYSAVKIKRACEMVKGQHKGNWRHDINILTPQAEAVGTIGVIRSLGSAGYCVHACSHDPKALGLRSNLSLIHI